MLCMYAAASRYGYDMISRQHPPPLTQDGCMSIHLVAVRVSGYVIEHCVGSSTEPHASVGELTPCRGHMECTGQHGPLWTPLDVVNPVSVILHDLA